MKGLAFGNTGASDRISDILRLEKKSRLRVIKYSSRESKSHPANLGRRHFLNLG
jgi:hypothetical protein